MARRRGSSGSWPTESQPDTIGAILAPEAGPSGDMGDGGSPQVPGPTMSPLFAAPENDGIDRNSRFEVSEVPASSLGTSDQESVPSLAGSLSTFAFTEILSLLASSTQTGELRVEGESVDGRVWLDHGELSGASVGMTSTLVEAIFEFACATEGWFYFSPWTASPDGGATVAVAAVVEEVLPQLEEWRELRTRVPIDAVVALCLDAPHHDVQIRANQWPVLATIGAGGHTVAAVLDTVELNPVVGLRILGELHAMGLIELIAPFDPAASGTSPLYGFPTDNGISTGNGSRVDTPVPGDPSTQVVDPEPDHRQPDQPPVPTDPSDETAIEPVVGLADVAVMPPPIVDDPWCRAETSFGSGTDGVA